jgi:hypothetical protein
LIRTFRFPSIDRVVHGAGAVARVPQLVDELAGRRVMIVTGRTLASRTPLIEALESALGTRHAGTFGRMGAHALSAPFRASWCGVARAGDPAHEGVGPWPGYTPGDRATMRLGQHSGVERDPAAARVAALAAAGVSP